MDLPPTSKRYPNASFQDPCFTKKAFTFATIASEGPWRSALGTGLPVPRKTISTSLDNVGGVADCCACAQKGIAAAMDANIINSGRNQQRPAGRIGMSEPPCVGAVAGKVYSLRLTRACLRRLLPPSVQQTHQSYGGMGQARAAT